MLQKIRDINLGSMLMAGGLVFIVFGMEISDGNGIKRTLLCFDQGCVHVQKMSRVALGIFTILVGFYMKFIRR